MRKFLSKPVYSCMEILGYLFLFSVIKYIIGSDTGFSDFDLSDTIWFSVAVVVLCTTGTLSDKYRRRYWRVEDKSEDAQVEKTWNDLR